MHEINIELKGEIQKYLVIFNISLSNSLIEPVAKN